MTLPEKDLNGKEFQAAGLAGKPVLILVIRPYHNGVRKELPLLKKAVAYAQSKGVQVLGAVYNYYWTPKLKKQAIDFVKREKLSFPCLPVCRDWVKRYGILTLPSHVLVSAGGKVLYHLDGALGEQWKLNALVDVLSEVAK